MINIDIDIDTFKYKVTDSICSTLKVTRKVGIK